MPHDDDATPPNPIGTILDLGAAVHEMRRLSDDLLDRVERAVGVLHSGTLTFHDPDSCACPAHTARRILLDEQGPHDAASPEDA